MLSCSFIVCHLLSSTLERVGSTTSRRKFIRSSTAFFRRGSVRSELGRRVERLTSRGAYRTLLCNYWYLWRHVDELLAVRANFETFDHSYLNLAWSECQQVTEFWKRHINRVKNLPSNLIILSVLGSWVIELNDPDLKRFPLNHNVASIVQAVASKKWL